MEKISVKKLIEFRGKTGNWKKKYVEKLIAPKEKKAIDKKGGDYWISSTSAISKSFKENDNQIIKDRIAELDKKLRDSEYNNKGMCRDNITALRNYLDFDFNNWKPSSDISFLKHPNSILSIRDIPIEVKPNCIFSTENNEIGAIWLIGQKAGFSDADRGMYAEALYRSLNELYSKNNTIASEYCLAVDIVSNKTISYSQLKQNEIPAILRPTINELIKLI